jgi:DNA-binding NarL/FixJ family response regulator
MKPLSIVIAQDDSHSADALVSSLGEHFKSVSMAHNLEELRHTVAKHRADVAVVDLEIANLLELDELRREFPQLTVVCTHRLADEQMWSAALAAGAQDCCHPSDVRSIVHAANRTQVMARSTAA